MGIKIDEKIIEADEEATLSIPTTGAKRSPRRWHFSKGGV
jgi:hypothetical protein